TMFPPVRPRGYLEVRYLDTQPAGEWIAPVAVLVAVFSSERLVDTVLEVTAPTQGHWVHAARAGLADPRLARAAGAVLDLVRQHSPLMSPLVWDLAHVGNQEELWLVRDVGGAEPVRCDIDHLYDAFKHPRKDRPALPLLGPAEARAYVAQVRRKAFDVLE